MTALGQLALVVALVFVAYVAVVLIPRAPRVRRDETEHDEGQSTDEHGQSQGRDHSG